MSYQAYLDYVKSNNEQFMYYNSIMELMEVDKWLLLPTEGQEYRKKLSAYVAAQKSGLFECEEAKKAAEYLKQVNLNEVEDYIERGLIRSFLFRYRNQTSVPKELTRQYTMLKVEAMGKWIQARAQKDYQIFMPFLGQIFEMKKEIAKAINPDSDVFDTLLDTTDEGTTSAVVSREFDVLKNGLTELRKYIEASATKPNEQILNMELNQAKLDAFVMRLARESGYLESRGGFTNKVVHAFESTMGPRDARVSLHHGNKLDMIFCGLHEAGHAMYSSGGNDRVNEANMWGGIHGGFQEGMARFNENIIGRSRAYWEHYYPILQSEFSEFAQIPFEEFYAALNMVKPGLRRITADEVNYSLHVILRYELERDYFAGKLDIVDMANAWNDLSEAYLGIRPSNDTEGILQDLHWASDYIGYFQSYALGNVYGGQIREAMLKDIPDYEEYIRKGDFTKTNEWLDQNIRQYGSCFTASEMIQKITGNEIDAKPFLRYLNEKYRKIYK